MFLNALTNRVSDYYLEIARGNVPGQTIRNVDGRNPAAGTVSEDVWDAGALRSIAYDGQTGNFTIGLTITGAISGATARIVIDDDDGADGTLTIADLTGSFQNDETITDTSTGSATTNGVSSSLGTLIYPTAGEQWEIFSDSANDTSAGTGMRTVQVTYLDDNHVQQTENKTLNGTKPISKTPVFSQGIFLSLARFSHIGYEIIDAFAKTFFVFGFR